MSIHDSSFAVYHIFHIDRITYGPIGRLIGATSHHPIFTGCIPDCILKLEEGKYIKFDPFYLQSSCSPLTGHAADNK